MLTQEEKREALHTVKRCLIKAHDEIEATADFIELRLQTEQALAMSREYGRICRVLGVLEEQIAAIGNQLNKLK